MLDVVPRIHGPLLSPLRIEVDLAETGLGLETKTKTTSSNHGPEEMED